jgi:peroxiredoxin
MEKGNIAPDFVLQTTEGQTVSLYKSLQGCSSVLLIFLRHLG